jgi:hypothetical protein
LIINRNYLPSEVKTLAKLPFYEKPNYPVFSIGKQETTHMMEIIEFLRWTLDNDRLEIANYLPEMDDNSFFLVAATGLGKTVGVPIHVLIRQIQRTGKSPKPTPKVWVVEPRIPIAIEQAEYMNHLWNEFCIKYSRTKKRAAPLFGCVTSASGRVNPEAPVQFVTTGIFELLSREGKLHSVNDRVIIDEAHVTVEQNAGVELGIALGRKAGVTIDYMSATVDVTGLQDILGVSRIIRADKARNVIWKSNLLRPLGEVIGDLVSNTLIYPNTSSAYFPDGEFRDATRVIESVLETGRSHGMLIVVNSFNGDTSDTRTLTKKLNKQFPDMPVLHLAGDVVRDPRKQSAFKRRLRDIEATTQNYIIISTSVVEMGITFPTLDYVVTMDAGYAQETVGDVTFPVVAPLGVNSLLQRIGRVGRRRPGIAYISNEVDADYASLEDKELNGKALDYEPICYPLQNAPLMFLAYQALAEAPGRAEAWLEALNLPSRIHENVERMEYFREQIDRLHGLGLAEDGALTSLGQHMSQWIGRVDIAYATHLQRRFLEGAPFEEVLFWIVAAALSNTPLVSLRASHGYFIDPMGRHKKVANRIDLWSSGAHEDYILFGAICVASQVAPRHFWGSQDSTVVTGIGLSKWCNWAGLDGRKFVKTAKAICDIADLFEKINGDSDGYKMLFAKRLSKDLATVDWEAVYRTLPTDRIVGELADLNGVVTVRLSFNDAVSAFDWINDDHGYAGIVSQDDTPIALEDGKQYIARVVPSRSDQSAEVGWRLSSIGKLPPAVDELDLLRARLLQETSIVQAPKPKSGFFTRLFGRS